MNSPTSVNGFSLTSHTITAIAIAPTKIVSMTRVRKLSSSIHRRMALRLVCQNPLDLYENPLCTVCFPAGAQDSRAPPRQRAAEIAFLKIELGEG
jgi:hypothetical protein